MKGLVILRLLALTLTLSVGLCLAGDLTGHIVLTKKVTKARVTVPVYELRGASPAVSAEMPDSNEFGSMAVFLEGQLPHPDQFLRAELEQIGQRFEPRLVVIPAGSSVSFPNSDPIFHNVFSLSSAKKFDLGYYPAGQTRIVKFDQAGVVQVYCHLHPNMYAAIVVAPSRWYTKPADDGAFSFEGVPPGKYHVVAWHMNAGFARKEVQVPAAGGAEVVISLPMRPGENSH